MPEKNTHKTLMVAHGLDVSKNPGSGFMERFSMNIEYGDSDEDHTLYTVKFSLLGNEENKGFEILTTNDQQVIFHSHSEFRGELDADLRNRLIETALDQVERTLYPYDLLQINEFLGELDIVRYV